MAPSSCWRKAVGASTWGIRRRVQRLFPRARARRHGRIPRECRRMTPPSPGAARHGPAARASPPLEFRAALGMFATGVTIVTARDADGAPRRPDRQLVQLGVADAAAGAVEPVAPRRLDAGLQRRLALRDQHPRRRPARAGRALRRQGRRPLRRRGLRTRAPAARRCSKARSRCSSASTAAATKRATTSSSSARSSAARTAQGAQPLIFHGGRYFTELPL